jgi:hypothetical protein
MLSLVVILTTACAKNTVVGDSYCTSLIPMRAYFYLESEDEHLFAEIHGNMKRYESRGCDD